MEAWSSLRRVGHCLCFLADWDWEKEFHSPGILLLQEKCKEINHLLSIKVEQACKWRTRFQTNKTSVSRVRWKVIVSKYIDLGIVNQVENEPMILFVITTNLPHPPAKLDFVIIRDWCQLNMHWKYLKFWTVFVFSTFNRVVSGFLNVNGGSSSGIPSNLGILDQIAALHWIQENIQDFGGQHSGLLEQRRIWLWHICRRKSQC